MPVLTFKYKRLVEALGEKYSINELARLLEALKAEVAIIDEDTIEAEIEVDRPDLYTSEGFARALKGYIGLEKGIPRYEVIETNYEILVDNVETRPFIAGVIVWDVDVDDAFLEELIQFQEKLHASLGLNRRRFAIGLHDLEALPSNKLYYRMEHIREVRFRPLGLSVEKSLEWVLEGTEQGLKYGRISLKEHMHPVLYSGDLVISVPPVINSEDTRVKPGTRSIFVDVTGVNERAVSDAIAVIAANLAERSRSRRIGLVRIVYNNSGKTITTPSTRPFSLNLNLSDAEKLLGVNLTVEEAIDALERARFNAKHIEDKTLNVDAPFYRIDVLHWVDLAEDIMLMKGIDNLAPRPPRTMLRGSLLPFRTWEREARKLLAGLGFIEIYSFTLTSCRDQEELGGISRDKLVRVKNPTHREMDCLRAALTPILLRIASRNQSIIPLKVFEIGETIEVDERSETRTTKRMKLAILIMDRKVGYEDVQAYLYTLLHLLGDRIVSVEEYEHPLLIEGRAARIETRQGVKGYLGEVRPEYLERLGIYNPIAIAEIDYTLLGGGRVSPAPNTYAS